MQLSQTVPPANTSIYGETCLWAQLQYPLVLEMLSLPLEVLINMVKTFKTKINLTLSCHSDYANN